VSIHSFTDGSGCVFFDVCSAETSTISVPDQKLNALIGEYILLPEVERSSHLTHYLFLKQFLAISPT
jgi:hypothetical protein